MLLMLRCYAGIESSAVSPSMSAASARRRSTTVRRPAATVWGSAARRRMAAAASTVTGSGVPATAVTRGRTSAATAIAAAIAAVRAAATITTSAIRARSNDGLPHVEWRAGVSTVSRTG